MPRFFEVAFDLHPGQISNILKSTYGFHIIMVEEKREAHKMTFAEALPGITQKLRQLEEEKAYQKWVDLALHTVVVNTPKVY